MKKYRATSIVIAAACLWLLIVFFVVVYVPQPLPAVVVQEEPLILQVEDGRQFQLLGVRGSAEERYIVYVDIKTGRVKAILQDGRFLFEE